MIPTKFRSKTPAKRATDDLSPALGGKSNILIAAVEVFTPVARRIDRRLIRMTTAQWTKPDWSLSGKLLKMALLVVLHSRMIRRLELPTPYVNRFDSVGSPNAGVTIVML